VTSAPSACILGAGLLTVDSICVNVYPGREFSRISSATPDMYHDIRPRMTHENTGPLPSPTYQHFMLLNGLKFSSYKV